MVNQSCKPEESKTLSLTSCVMACSCHEKMEVFDLSLSDVLRRALKYKDCCNSKIYFELELVFSDEYGITMGKKCWSKWDLFPQDNIT